MILVVTGLRDSPSHTGPFFWRIEGNTSARLWHNFPEASYPTFPKTLQLLMLCRFAQHILGKNMQKTHIWGISYLNRMVFSPQKWCPRPWWFNAPYDVLPLEPPQPLQAPPFRSVRPWLRCLRRLRTLGRWRFVDLDFECIITNHQISNSDQIWYH